jgi:Hint domain
MTGDVENLSVGAQRTRRNILKMGAMLAPVALARIKTARAMAKRPCAVCNCFLRGTKIQTAEGERKVEDLAIGDMLPTMFGGMTPIQWIGRYPLKKSDPSKPWVKDAMPVRIARSALAPGVPQADLYATGGHALFVDGLLIAVGNLINGTTITRHEAREYDELEFFHIKLERHDVIYAEGAPVETLLDVDERAVNFAEYFRRYGTPKTQEALCAPRVSYGGERGQLKSRLRSAISPWIDRREPIDVIRDRLEERGLALSRRLELAS